MDKPRTPAQIEASRANGARSHGPVTDAGKAASSQNALKHGLTARAVVLPSENPEHFEQLLATLAAQTQPATDAEMLCVEEMAVAQWKQRRIWTLETAALALRTAAQPPELLPGLQNPDPVAGTFVAWSDLHKSLADFSWHDVRLQRQYARALRTLDHLKSLRKKQKIEIEPDQEAA